MTRTNPYESAADRVTVLATGADTLGGAGVVRCLRAADGRSMRIVGTGLGGADGFGLVDEHYAVPAGYDAAYVPRMLDVVERKAVDVVLPLTTPELEPLATHRDEFEDAGARVAVSDPDALSTATDKGSLYEFLAANDFASAPEFVATETRAEFVDACDELGYPDRRVCVKRPAASGRRGFRVLDAEHDRFERLLTRPPDDPVTTLEAVLPVLDEAQSYPRLVVMEYLPGREYSVDVLARGDACGPVVPCSRERTRAGFSCAGTVERDETLATQAARICRGLGLEYTVHLRFRHDDDRPTLVDVDPRVAETAAMCAGAGVNLPYLSVEYALGEPVTQPDVAWGTRVSRHWQEFVRRPGGERFRLRAEGTDVPR